MVEIDHAKFAVELLNGNVNVNMTQMAAKYGKRVTHWLELEESKTYVDLLAMSVKTASADLLEVRKGGIPGNQGTWAKDRRIALRFAQWLDPVFAIHVDTMLVKLITNQAVVAEPINGVWPLIQNGTVGYPRKEILQAAGYSFTSGNVSRMVKHYGREHFFSIYRTSCVSLQMAQLITKRGEVRQLEIDFKGGAAK